MKMPRLLLSSLMAIGVAVAASAQVVDPATGTRENSAPAIKVKPEPGAENPAMGPRNSDTGQDDTDADAPKNSFGSGSGSRGTRPNEVPAKAGSGNTLD
jgi:hypothetical protein